MPSPLVPHYTVVWEIGGIHLAVMVDDLLLYLLWSLCLVLLWTCNYIHYHLPYISIFLHVLNFGFVAAIALASGRSQQRPNVCGRHDHRHVCEESNERTAQKHGCFFSSSCRYLISTTSFCKIYIIINSLLVNFSCEAACLHSERSRNSKRAPGIQKGEVRKPVLYKSK